MLAPPAFRAEHALLGAEYDNMLACIRCGLCLTSCPTYVLSLHESEGPRGRVGMARALTEGHLRLTPDLVEHELNCLVCDACSAVCPAGVDMDPLQVVLRTAMERERRRPWWQSVVRRLVFGWLFTDMRHFRAVVRLLWLYQRLGGQWFATRSGVLKLLGLSGMARLLPPLPARFVVPRGQVYAAVRAPARPAALFAGCVMSTALADVDRATVRVLQRAGCTVSNPAGQGCCGALNAHGGDLEGALQLARANIAAFESTDGPIVVNSAGCGAMLKDYAHHLRTDPVWAERARAFTARVRDLSEVLTSSDLPVGRPVARRVVYQDACHLLHAQRISRQPRDLLRAVPDLEVVEIAEAGLCCGSAGIYNITNPRESLLLRERKLDSAVRVQPDLIVTANPGCLLQLRAGLAERASAVQVRHLAEVLEQASAP
ncbi:MAG: heterodisulfide reductase-related iron-sulfur binding cluster [Chloroflexota bacterium]|nr:heterodisulfide reductase-related iron-sulfur binding cluster [Chloroflexota bacterium]